MSQCASFEACNFKETNAQNDIATANGMLPTPEVTPTSTSVPTVVPRPSITASTGVRIFVPRVSQPTWGPAVNGSGRRSTTVVGLPVPPKGHHGR
jgi:hypothetical protein